MASLRRRGRHPAAAPFDGLQDEQAVGAAYEAHGAEIYRFALRGLGDPGAAEDVVQETFLRAWRAADRYDPSLASLRVWLFAIARNTMIDHHRSSRTGRHDLVDLTDPDLDPSLEPGRAGRTDDTTDQVLHGWVVQEALHRLSPEHRVALVETHLKDRPYAEVAAEQGVPVGTLRSRVFYGLKAMRVTMDEMGVTP